VHPVEIVTSTGEGMMEVTRRVLLEITDRAMPVLDVVRQRRERHEKAKARREGEGEKEAPPPPLVPFLVGFLALSAIFSAVLCLEICGV
jgi:hypothetical protein